MSNLPTSSHTLSPSPVSSSPAAAAGASDNLPSPSVAHAPLHVPLTLYLKSMQSQNGVKHNDFMRYRQYCSRKLLRMRKALKFQQGRNRYVGKALPECIQDERYLVLVLVHAERCWSYGMQLKAETAVAAVPNNRARLHSVRRFGKAARYAVQLEELCSEFADKKTQLDSKAYRQWLNAVWLMEKSEWEKSLESLLGAVESYRSLRTVSAGQAENEGTEEETIFKSKLEELQPSIRQCQYQLNRKGVDWKKLVLDSGRPDAEDSVVMEKVELPPAAQWRGKDVIPPSEIVGEGIRRCENLRQTESAALDSLDWTDHEAVKQHIVSSGRVGIDNRYGRLGAAYQETLQTIHSEMMSLVTIRETSRVCMRMCGFTWVDG
eukprot:GHVQ01004033.1.p1 GENE.GHVQ01004033.1~~GHVQ01004033.1.p1  ORF type:complete len:377 (+),score=71.66 GHVQ01004033.1:502-1632(+)